MSKTIRNDRVARGKSFFVPAFFAASTAVGCSEPMDSESGEVDQTSSEVLNGISDFSEFRADDRRVPATVRLRNMTLPANCPGTVGLGTGLLLRNDVVLTARHVVTDYAQACSGPTRLAPLNQLFVYAANSSSNPPSCAGSACSQPASVHFAPGGADVALIFLNTPVRGYQNSTLTHFVPMYVHDPARYVGKRNWISGYGINNCNGTGHGTLRFGTVTMDSRTSSHLRFEPGTTDQLAASGDSGGPAWSDVFGETWPQSALGVASTAGCGQVAYYVAPEAYRDWARTLIANDKSTITYEFGTSTNINPPFWVADHPDNPNEVPQWYLSGGRLREDSNSLGQTSSDQPNYPDGPLMLHAGDIHESVWLDVNVQSSDNDAAGFVFRYVDPTHYYIAAINQQSGLARIYKREGNTFTLLASASKSVNWSVSGGADLQLRVQDYTFRFYVNGSLAVTATDSEYPVGSVGLFKYALDDASFDHFKVTPKAPATTASWPL